MGNQQLNLEDRSTKSLARPPRQLVWGRGSLLALILLLLLHYGFYRLFRGALPANPQVIAHRGGPAYAPENTLAAFRHALTIGVDWLEMDIQMTREGELIVMHDETVNRTTNDRGWVKELTLAEIRALDAGNGEVVPTFAEVISLAKEAEVKLLPEVKSPHLYPGIEAKIVRAIVETDYVAHTVVQSFDPQALSRIKALNPAIRVCRLYGPGTLSLSRPQPSEVEILCPMAEMIVLNPWMIKQAHSAGRPVFVWFGLIEHPLVMRFLLALGVDGLIVDDPKALVSILK